MRISFWIQRLAKISNFIFQLHDIGCHCFYVRLADRIWTQTLQFATLPVVLRAIIATHGHALSGYARLHHSSTLIVITPIKNTAHHGTRRSAQS